MFDIPRSAGYSNPQSVQYDPNILIFGRPNFLAFLISTTAIKKHVKNINAKVNMYKIQNLLLYSTYTLRRQRRRIVHEYPDGCDRQGEGSLLH